MEIKIQQILVWNLIEWLSQQLTQAQRDLAGHCYQTPEPGYPRSNQSDSPEGIALQFHQQITQEGY